VLFGFCLEDGAGLKNQPRTPKNERHSFIEVIKDILLVAKAKEKAMYSHGEAN